MQLRKTSEGAGDLARSGQQQRDAALLRATSELFVHDASHDRDDIQRFEELATHYLPKVRRDDRVFVADRLAGCNDAPQAVVRMLARDVIEVAAAVIKHSPVLEPLDLLSVIAATGVEHHRLIAQRSDLDPQVKRALRLTGDGEVLSHLQRGQTTDEESDTGETDRHGETGASEADQIAPTHATAPRERVDPRDFLSLDRGMRLRVLADFATRPQPRRYGGSANRLDRAFRSILSAAKIVGFARTGQRDALVSAISDGLELEADFVKTCVGDATGEPLAVLLKALRLEEVQAQQVFLLACPAGRDTATFFPLADLYAGMEPTVAESLCESWRAAAQGRGGEHEPHLAPEGRRQRSGAIPATSQGPSIPADQAKRA